MGSFQKKGKPRPGWEGRGYNRDWNESWWRNDEEEEERERERLEREVEVNH